MNFSMTFTDETGFESAGIEAKAKAAATKSIYEAIKYDPEFREASFKMLREKKGKELCSTIKAVLVNDTLRLYSDMSIEASQSGPQNEKALADAFGLLASMRSNAAWAERLATALGMLDENGIDLIACYREAYSRFEIEMDFYMELRRGNSPR
ncbi:MAG: hypothetical protein QXW10_03015 [Candidatus Micrarchaeaceae archaeon]